MDQFGAHTPELPKAKKPKSKVKRKARKFWSWVTCVRNDTDESSDDTTSSIGVIPAAVDRKEDATEQLSTENLDHSGPGNAAVIKDRENAATQVLSLQEKHAAQSKEVERLQAKMEKLQGVEGYLESYIVSLKKEVKEREQANEEQKQFMLQLRAGMRQLEADSEQQLQHRVASHRAELREMMDRFTQEAEALRVENQVLRTEKEQLAKANQEYQQQLLREAELHRQEIEKISQHYEAKLQQQRAETMAPCSNMDLQEQRLKLQKETELQEKLLTSGQMVSMDADFHSVALGKKKLEQKEKLQDLNKPQEEDRTEEEEEKRTEEEEEEDRTEKEEENRTEEEEQENRTEEEEEEEEDRTEKEEENRTEEEEEEEDRTEKEEELAEIEEGSSAYRLRGMSLKLVQGRSPTIMERDAYEQQLKDRMRSKDFRERLAAVDQLVTDTENRPQMVVGCRFAVFDALAERLAESNRKVNLRVLEVLQKVIPMLGNDVAEVVNVLIPAIVDNHLNSKSSTIYNAASGAIHALIHNIDQILLLDAFCSKTWSATGRAKGELIKNVAELVSELYQRKPQTVEKKVLPLLWPLLDSNRHKEVTATLCRALHSQLGPRLRTCASLQPMQIKDRLNQLLQTF